MTEIKNNLVERPHRFPIAETPPLQTIVRRIAVNSTAEEAHNDDCHLEFYSDLVDFSCKGVKVALPFQASFNERLAIRMEFAEADYCFKSEAVVRHIRLDGERWVAGCSIEPDLPDFVLDYLANLSGKDRRRYPRDPVFGEGFFKREGDAQASPAEFINLSEGGFCAKVTAMPLLSERVHFLILDKLNVRRQISARIRWTRKVEGENAYILGASFADNTSYKLMKSVLRVDKLPSPIKPRTETIGWYVIAACVMCMIIPPAAPFLFNSLGQPPAVTQASSMSGSVPTEDVMIHTNRKPVTHAIFHPSHVDTPQFDTSKVTELPFVSEPIRHQSPFLIVVEELELQPTSEPLSIEPIEDFSSRRAQSNQRSQLELPAPLKALQPPQLDLPLPEASHNSSSRRNKSTR